jgi:cytosine/adenosine deaminase-related metal-dependent hydrolase
MRKIGADYIFPVSSDPIKNGIIIIDDHGTIKEIIDNKEDNKPIDNLEFYNGIIVPGFINAHSHIELSHYKGKIESKKKLPYFIESILKLRQTEKSIPELIQEADKKMLQNGFVAVGDVSNTDDSFKIKAQSKIYYHTFIEVLGNEPEKANLIFEYAFKLKKNLSELGLKGSIIPHAPYSVSNKLFHFIHQEFDKQPNIYSIHNQETQSENELFRTKTGRLTETLAHCGLLDKNFQPSDKSSLASIINYLPLRSKIILVHNIFTSQDDIDLIKKIDSEVFWAICPNSNFYIENAMADLSMFRSNNLNITIGTDSLASNTDLNILAEISTIQQIYPKIEFTEILKWATINGAKALGIDQIFGSLEENKKPGLILIENFNFSEMKLQSQSNIKLLHSVTN